MGHLVPNEYYILSYGHQRIFQARNDLGLRAFSDRVKWSWKDTLLENVYFLQEGSISPCVEMQPGTFRDLLPLIDYVLRGDVWMAEGYRGPPPPELFHDASNVRNAL